MEHQDWGNVSWDTRGSKKSGQSKKKQLQTAARQGSVDVDKKYNAGTNTQSSSGEGKSAVKIEAETESFSVPKVSVELRKLIMQARTSAKMTQKDLATACNLKVSIIQDYEAGKAIPNSAMLKKIERAIKQKSPEFQIGTFTKAHKKALDKQKAKAKAAASVSGSGSGAKAGTGSGAGAGGAKGKGNQVPKARRF